MKSMRMIRTVSVAVGLMIPMAGTALAANATLDTTGPQSTQTVTVDNSVKVDQTNVNITKTSNTNVQQATTGDVSAFDNTSVFGAGGSGAASNSNGTATTVTNAGAPVVSSLVSNPVSGGLGTTNCGCGSLGKGGSVLGASTGGFGGGSVATLPTVGALVPVDVSALRAAWHPQSSAPTTTLVKQASGITNLMLGVAALLSLLGGLGSAAYTRRKERRV